MLHFTNIFRKARNREHTLCRQQGFVLFVVLVFLQIFTMLGISLLQKNIMQLKIAGLQWQHQNLSIQAESNLERIERHLERVVPPCLIPLQDAENIVIRDLAWWKATSCAGNFNGFQYYYVVEMLGKDNCTFIRKNRQSIAYFYRISLLMIASETESTARVIVQSIFLREGFATEICRLPPRVTNEGRQAWNELV